MLILHYEILVTQNIHGFDDAHPKSSWLACLLVPPSFFLQEQASYIISERNPEHRVPPSFKLLRRSPTLCGGTSRKKQCRISRNASCGLVEVVLESKSPTEICEVQPCVLLEASSSSSRFVRRSYSRMMRSKIQERLSICW